MTKAKGLFRFTELLAAVVNFPAGQRSFTFGDCWMFLSSQILQLNWSEALENRALRRTFGPKWDKIRWECRKLHKEELNDLYSPNISRVITIRKIRWWRRMASSYSKYGQEERCIQGFGGVGKT